MITLILNNISNLNVSLQVGDLIYAKSTQTQVGAEDQEQDATGAYSPTEGQNMVGILRKINMLVGNNVELLIEDTNEEFSSYIPTNGDFIMFSKHDQSVGDVIGYYAQARFVNFSRKKAEIFSVGSEVTINNI